MPKTNLILRRRRVRGDWTWAVWRMDDPQSFEKLAERRHLGEALVEARSPHSPASQTEPSEGAACPPQKH
jgi:hypothetical protein